MLTASDTERFWNKVEIQGPDDCWLWRAGLTGQGYGGFHLGGSTVMAHRVSYELTYGPVPEGLVIRHRECDNPPCVNPRHLMPGTHRQNKADSTGKMRHLFGERHHKTPLSETDVRAIRTDHLRGARPVDLAKTYGISNVAIINILKGQSWRCVTHGISVYRTHRADETAYRRTRITALRKEGRTQAEVAALLGISQAAVSNLENAT